MRRLLAWLLVPLLPLAVVLGILALQDAPGAPQAIAPVVALPAPAPPPPSRAWDLPVRRADGSPAGDAVLIVIEPEVVQAKVSADGLAHFTLRSSEPVRVMAWAPGHAVREAGPWTSAPAELRLDALKQTTPAAGAPLQPVTLLLRIVDQDGAPIPEALLLVRSAAHPEDAPWFAFAAADGRARCGVEAGELSVEVYAPNRTPRKPWLLGSRLLSATSEEIAWSVAVASLTLEGLPAMEPVELSREAEACDLITSSEQGEAAWAFLPPGAWAMSTASGKQSVELQPGALRMRWKPD